MGDFEGLKDKMVGTVRFELTASCSQSRRANQTTLRPVKKNTPKVMQTTWQRNFYKFANLLLPETFSGCENNISSHHDILMR